MPKWTASRMSRHIRIVQVVTVPVSLRFIHGQPKFLVDRGFRSTLVSSPGVNLVTDAGEDGAESFPILMSRTISPRTDFVSLCRVIGMNIRVRPHIVHAQTPKAGLLGMLAAWMTRRPVRVYSILGLKYSTATGGRRKLLKIMERLSCRLASSVICVSESMRDAAIAERLAQPDKLRVMAGGSVNGIDADHHFNPSCIPDETRSSTRHSCGISDDAVAVGFVGRIVNDKGIVELASASGNGKRPVIIS